MESKGRLEGRGTLLTLVRHTAACEEHLRRRCSSTTTILRIRRRDVLHERRVSLHPQRCSGDVPGAVVILSPANRLRGRVESETLLPGSTACYVLS